MKTTNKISIGLTIALAVILLILLTMQLANAETSDTRFAQGIVRSGSQGVDAIVYADGEFVAVTASWPATGVWQGMVPVAEAVTFSFRTDGYICPPQTVDTRPGEVGAELWITEECWLNVHLPIVQRGE